MNTSTPSPNPFELAIESLETALADLAVNARAVLALVQRKATHKYNDAKVSDRADLSRLELVLSELLSALPARTA
jgi:hypothetical protein